MKKAISALLAIAMLLTACSSTSSTSSGTGEASSSSSSSGETSTESSASSEPLTLHAFQYVVENQQVDFPTMWFYQELEEKTGVHVEWEQVKDGDWDTRLNLMFASGDYPDVIMRGSLDVEEYGVTQGIIVPLDDYIEENMPNYYSRLSMNNSNASIPASDGKSYFIGNLVAQNVNHDGSHYINKTWLDALGLEIPQTIEELNQALIAFRDNDPNGNGEADEIPFCAGDLIHQTQGVYTHFANFGVPLQRYIYACITDGDQVVFPGYMEGFRPALEWLNMCYTEGLLDPEAITQDSNVWASKMNEGRVGYTTYLRLLNTALQPEIAEQYVSILPPASEYGVSVPRILEVSDFGAALTIANEHIPETLQWLDAQFETETMMISYNGPIEEGGPIEPTMQINDEGKYEILYVPENNELYNYVPVMLGQFFAPGDYYFDIYEMPPHRVERYESSQQYEEGGVLEETSFEYLSKLCKMDSDSALEATRLFTEIDKFMQESIASFITNGVTDESWQTFLDTAAAVGVDRYIELYQTAYDNYLANQ